MSKSIKSFKELWNLLAETLPPALDETLDTQMDMSEPQKPAEPESQSNSETKVAAATDASADSISMIGGDTAGEPDYMENIQSPPPPLDDQAKTLLADIRKYASWSGEGGQIKLNPLLVLFKERYPENQSELDQAVNDGIEDAKLFTKAYKLGSGNNPQARQEFKKLLSSLPSDTPAPVKYKLQSQFTKGKTAAERYSKERKRKHRGRPLSTVQPRSAVQRTQLPGPLKSDRREKLNMVPVSELHPNDLRGLNPAQQWTLLIDESGSVFDEKTETSRKQKLGCFVGLLLPGNGNMLLTPLDKGWHAVDCSDPSEIDTLVQAVLDASVGVLGIEVKAVPMTVGERWLDGVALLIDWMLRLLPLNQDCQLKVLIEQRGVFSPEMDWSLLRRSCLRRLALTFPERAARIDLSVSSICKTGHPANGYVDAITYTWAGTSESSSQRLKLSGWRGTCLLGQADGVDARSMLDAWDVFAQGINLLPENWWAMVRSSEARQPSALLTTFLDRVGAEAKADIRRWGDFVAEVKRRMAASPVDLNSLGAAIDWLQRYQPEDTGILPMLRLIWLTVQLARANHFGKTEADWLSELEALSERLFDEAAPLVCHADLHRAVAATNRFDFTAAGQALDRWYDCPPAVPGLRYWAQVISSRGQHAAFVGDQSQAIDYFRQAMSGFERLSDPEARNRDLNQTGCYLAIAMIDDHQGTSYADAQSAVERIVGPLPEAACRLAGSIDSGDRYSHHLLLRWLVYRGASETWRAYLDRRPDWDVGAGHPWPLIQLYRSLLLRDVDPQAAVRLSLDGARLAYDAQQGPTVRFIGACCRTVAAAWGKPWSEANAELDALAEQLPAAAKSLAVVRTFCQKSDDPRDMLTQALPFNFR